MYQQAREMITLNTCIEINDDPEGMTILPLWEDHTIRSYDKIIRLGHSKSIWNFENTDHYIFNKLCGNLTSNHSCLEN